MTILALVLMTCSTEVIYRILQFECTPLVNRHLFLMNCTDDFSSIITHAISTLTTSGSWRCFLRQICDKKLCTHSELNNIVALCQNSTWSVGWSWSRFIEVVANMWNSNNTNVRTRSLIFYFYYISVHLVLELYNIAGYTMLEYMKS